jgi:hypothetical protein
MKTDTILSLDINRGLATLTLRDAGPVRNDARIVIRALRHVFNGSTNLIGQRVQYKAQAGILLELAPSTEKGGTK